MRDFGFYYTYITGLIKERFDNGTMFIKKNEYYILSLESVSQIVLDPHYLVYLTQLSNHAMNVSKEHADIPNLPLHENLLYIINNFYLNKDFSTKKDFVLLPIYFYNNNNTIGGSNNNNNNNNTTLDEDIVFLKVSKKQWCLYFYNHLLKKLNLNGVRDIMYRVWNDDYTEKWIVDQDKVFKKVHLIFSLPFAFIVNLYVRTISNFFVYLRSNFLSKSSFVISREKNIEGGIFNNIDLYDYEITIGGKNIKCIDQIVKNKHMDIEKIFDDFVQKCIQYETSPFVPAPGEVKNKFWQSDKYGFETDFDTLMLTGLPISEFFNGNIFEYEPRKIKIINNEGIQFLFENYPMYGYEFISYFNVFRFFLGFVTEICFLNSINNPSNNTVPKNKLTISMSSDFINSFDTSYLDIFKVIFKHLVPNYHYLSNSCIFNNKITHKYDTFYSETYLTSKEPIKPIFVVPLYGYEYFENKFFLGQNINASSLQEIISSNLFFAIYKESTSAKEFGQRICGLLDSIYKHGIDKVKNNININQDGPCKKITLREPLVNDKDSQKFVFEKGYLEHYNIYFGNVSLFTKLKYLYNIDFDSFCIVDIKWFVKNKILYHIKINYFATLIDSCKFFYVFNQL